MGVLCSTTYFLMLFSFKPRAISIKSVILWITMNSTPLWLICVAYKSCNLSMFLWMKKKAMTPT